MHAALQTPAKFEPRETVSSQKRRPLGPTERVLVSLEVFISLSGMAGGAYMATHPLTAMPLRYLEGTWFHTWRWPGAALFFFVGVCPAVIVAATVKRLPVAKLGHLCLGIGLLAWILVEAAWVVVSPPLQMAVALIGLIIVVLAITELSQRRRG